jgi:hypothetical protein
MAASNSVLAAIVVNAVEDGSDVEISCSGSVDLTGLTLFLPSNESGKVKPDH